MSVKSITERDKPFILALIFVIGFFGLLFAGVGGANYGNPYVTEYIDKVLVGVAGIVGTIIGFYFKTKS